MLLLQGGRVGGTAGKWSLCNLTPVSRGYPLTPCFPLSILPSLASQGGFKELFKFTESLLPNWLQMLVWNPMKRKWNNVQQTQEIWAVTEFLTGCHWEILLRSHKKCLISDPNRHKMGTTATTNKAKSNKRQDGHRIRPLIICHWGPNTRLWWHALPHKTKQKDRTTESSRALADWWPTSEKADPFWVCIVIKIKQNVSPTPNKSESEGLVHLGKTLTPCFPALQFSSWQESG